jgi:hypothetical protein
MSQKCDVSRCCFCTWQNSYERGLLSGVFRSGKTVAEIACLAGCTGSNLICKILKLHRDFGHKKSIRPMSWLASLNQQDRAFVSSLPDANTSLFLDEIQECLIESRDVEVSIATLSHPSPTCTHIQTCIKGNIIANINITHY